jgi:hypothetical protein
MQFCPVLLQYKAIAVAIARFGLGGKVASRQLAVPFLDNAVRPVRAFVPLDPAQPKRERSEAVQYWLE